jgi:hypothetical protein
VSYLINNSNFEETISREVIGKKLPATHVNCSIGIRLPATLAVKEELGHQLQLQRQSRYDIMTVSKKKREHMLKH